MAAGLGDSQAKPICESRLLVLSLELTEASCCLFVHTEKQLGWAVNWVGWGGASGDLQGGSNSVSQVDRILDMTLVC